MNINRFGLSFTIGFTWFILMTIVFAIAGTFGDEYNARATHTLVYSTLILMWLVAAFWPEDVSP